MLEESPKDTCTIHNFGVNSHLVIPEVRPVGAYASMCKLHSLVGKSVCLVGSYSAFSSAMASRKPKASVFVVFPLSLKTVGRKDRGNQER